MKQEEWRTDSHALLPLTNALIVFVLSTFVQLWAFSDAANNKPYLCLHVQCPKFVPNFNQIRILATNSYESPKYKISRASVQWESRWYKKKDGQTERRTGRRADVTKLIGAFRGSVKSPKNCRNSTHHESPPQKKKTIRLRIEMEYDYELSRTATAPLSSGLSCRFEQGCANVPKMQTPPQNTRCQMGDMQQVRYWRPKNIGCHCTKFNRSGELKCGIFSHLG
jgi:hypothetical protein